jgi:Domain of unknown function (DUF4114)/PEP-CTERM motif
MKQLATNLGLAIFSILSLLSVSAKAEAAALRSDLLTTFSNLVQAESVAFDELALPKLDASKLYWNGKTNNVEIFFIDEKAGFKNQLLFSANDNPLEMIYDNISSTQSTVSEPDGVLTLGEGKALRTFTDATQLSFFIRANGFNGGQDIYGDDSYANTPVAGQTVNGDGLSHLIAYDYFDDVEKVNYTIIGFEDLWGALGATGGQNQNSDRDFNDVVFAIKGLSSNNPAANNPAETPEPSAMLGLLGVALFGGLRLKAFRRMVC